MLRLLLASLVCTSLCASSPEISFPTDITEVAEYCIEMAKLFAPREEDKGACFCVSRSCFFISPAVFRRYSPDYKDPLVDSRVVHFQEGKHIQHANVFSQLMYCVNTISGTGRYSSSERTTSVLSRLKYKKEHQWDITSSREYVKCEYKRPDQRLPIDVLKKAFDDIIVHLQSHWLLHRSSEHTVSLIKREDSSQSNFFRNALYCLMHSLLEGFCFAKSDIKCSTTDSLLPRAGDLILEINKEALDRFKTIFKTDVLIAFDGVAARRPSNPDTE